MSDPLYKRALLRLAADAHGAGRLAHAQAHGEAFNPACGDKVRMELALEAGRIVDLAHETRACVLTQASASILGAHVRGLAREDVADLRKAVEAMLTGTGPAPERPFEDFAALDGAAAIPGRHTCVLLPLDALLDALKPG